MDSSVIYRRISLRQGPAPEEIARAALQREGQELTRKRLTRSNDPNLAKLLRPFRRFSQSKQWDDAWSLYWFPLSFGEKNPDPRAACLLTRLFEFAGLQGATRQKMFLDQACVYPHLVQHLTLNGLTYMPMPTFGVRPEGETASMPDADAAKKIDLTKAYQAVMRQGPVRLEEIYPNAPSVVYWIQNSLEQARASLTGQGGWSCFLSEPDQREFFPGVIKQLASKLTDPILTGIPFIAPVMSAATFTRAPREQLEAWFELFTFCVAESPVDRGMIFASRVSLDELLIQLVEECKLNTRVARGR